MNINDLIGQAPAVVVGAGDKVVISVERYLTGQQLAEIQKHFKRRLPGTEVLVLQGGMSIEVTKAAPSSPSPPGAGVCTSATAA